LVMARIEKRPFSTYGLPVQRRLAGVFGIGAVWGLIGITALLLILRGDGAFYFGDLALHGSRILKFAAYWAFFFLIVGLFEEFIFRGYTLYTAASGIRFWPAAILLSAGFGAIHLGNPGENAIGIVGAAAIGLFFCLTIRRTGNLWFAVGFHASWDWGESFLYSVPDSGGMVPGHLLKSSFHGSSWITGGSVGPEGSVFVFLIIAVLWVVFDRMYPEVKYQAG
jgi:CAAX protease family protein